MIFLGISVIIPCSKHHIKYLDDLFNGLSKQNYTGDWEVILTIENCMEGRDIVNKIKDKYKFNKLKVLFSDRIDPSANRNLALKQVNSKHIAFIDSDCVPYANWLSEIEKMLEIHDGVQGIDYSLDNTPLGKFFESKQIEFLRNSVEKGRCKYIDTKNFAISAEAMMKIGGFDETLPTSEDADLGYRLYTSNFDTILDEKLIVLHRWQKGTIWGFFKWGRWYGKGEYIFNKKWYKYGTKEHIKDARDNLNSCFFYLIKVFKPNNEMRSIHLLFSVREVGVACGKLRMLLVDLLSF